MIVKSNKSNFTHLKVLPLILLMLGCTQPEQKVSTIENNPVDATNIETTPSEKNTTLMTEESTLPFTGTIQYFNLEGGFHGIITNDGKKLLPKNLAKEFLVDGTIISFSGSPIKNKVTFQQWGQLFKIDKVQLIKKGTKNAPSRS